MKLPAIVLLSVSVIASTKIPLRDGITPQKLGPVGVIPKRVAEQIPWESLKDYVLDYGEIQDGYVQANVTDYFLNLLVNVRTFLIDKGFDPMELSDEKESLFPVGSLTLTNGYISNLSSVTTSGSVLAKYTYGSKILDLVVPLSFDSIVIDYDYVTKITLIKISGDLEAKVKNFIIKMRAGFNFTNFHAFVDDIDVRDSGAIDLAIHGTGITDAIINLMSDVLVTLFHGVLISIINVVIQNPIRSVVEDINQAIDSILNPNSTLSDLMRFY